MITVENDFTFPDSYPLKRLGRPEDLLFFDIETTGFSGDYSQLYLIGCAYFRNGGWRLIQWFADRSDAEKDLLTAFFGFLRSFSTLVHFNGDGFDLPYLLKRCQACGLPYDFSGITSVDLYKKIRPYRSRLALDSLKQKSIERFLGIHRQDRFSGGELIEVYHHYLDTREERLYDLLMLHNREDLEGMPLILPILYYPDFFEGSFALSGQTVGADGPVSGASKYLGLSLTGCCALPVPIRWDGSFCGLPYHACADGNRLSLSLPLYEGTLKYFYDDYQNYYYLPCEDRAVHKSVGEFVERSARKKATPQTCYVPKTSLYLPQPAPIWEPAFRESYRAKTVYAEYAPGLLESPEALDAYLRALLG